MHFFRSELIVVSAFMMNVCRIFSRIEVSRYLTPFTSKRVSAELHGVWEKHNYTNSFFKWVNGNVRLRLIFGNPLNNLIKSGTKSIELLRRGHHEVFTHLGSRTCPMYARAHACITPWHANIFKLRVEFVTTLSTFVYFFKSCFPEKL